MNKLKNVGLYIACIGLLITFLLWLGKPGESVDSGQVNKNPTEVFQTNEREFDFGTISMAKGKVRHTFVLTNKTASDIILKKIYTSCMCTTAFYVSNRKRYGPFGMPGHGLTPSINEQIESGQSFNLEVEFDPAAHGSAGIGAVKRIVYLETVAGRQEIVVRAIVTP